MDQHVSIIDGISDLKAALFLIKLNPITGLSQSNLHASSFRRSVQQFTPESESGQAENRSQDLPLPADDAKIQLDNQVLHYIGSHVTTQTKCVC